MKIYFIQAGGTIDKDYIEQPTNHGYNFEIAKPAIKEILKNINPLFDFEIISLIKKDSLDLTDEDREKIYNTCQKIKGDKIIITHGTDTLSKTAKKLSSLKDKTIVLVGARKPYNFSNSDAMFNAGTAVGAINVLKKGIYIATNGIIFPWEKYK